MGEGQVQKDNRENEAALPGNRPFTVKPGDHFQKPLLGILELDHSPEVYFSGEEVRVNKLARRGEGTLFVY